MRRLSKGIVVVAGGLVTAGLLVFLARDALADAWSKATGTPEPEA